MISSHIQNQNWPEIYELPRRLQEKGMIVFPEYYPVITGNPNIATPQLLPDRIKLNNIDPTKHIHNPDTGKLFESEEVSLEPTSPVWGRALGDKCRGYQIQQEVTRHGVAQPRIGRVF